MKKIFFALLASALFIISCNDSGTSSAAEKNMAASDAISNAFQTGDISKIDSFVADDFVDHTDQGDKVGKDSLKAMVKLVHTNFKDMKTEKIKAVADDEFVFTWNRYSGTSDGSMGMPKGPYTMNTIEVAKFKDGKAVEHWAFVDMKDMMMMMGGQQQHMSSDIKTDTTKTDTTKAK